MALRRELLPLLLAAAFLLAGPAQALAAPAWLDAEPQPATAPAGQAPNVATDADGNSVAAWLDGGEVVAAYRPRGGPWGAPEGLDPGTPVAAGPLVTARASGDFVAAWILDTGDGGRRVRSATRPPGGDWSAETVRDGCCDDILALEGTADDSVTLVLREDGPPSSNTMGPGSDAWGPAQSLGISGYDRFAFAPDGSTVGVRLVQGCGEVFDCLEAIYRSSGAEGAWGNSEPIPDASSPFTGYAVEANPDSTYTLVWGEASSGDGGPSEPSSVRSSDRQAGPAGARGLGAPSPWQAPLTVAEAPDDVVGPGFDVAVGPDGTQVAVWQQDENMVGSLRAAGAAWGASENVGGVGSSTAQPYAMITTSGVPAVAWGSSGAGTAFAHGSHRGGAGTWSPVTLGPGAEGVVDLGDIDADGDGGGLTAFTGPTGVYTAGFDGSGPRFSAFSAPAGGTVGQPLAFSAAADDNWAGLAGIAWLFGDGTGESSATVAHSYGTAGTFAATARAADTIGNVTEQSGPVAVVPSIVVTESCAMNGSGDADKDGIVDGCDDNNGARRPRPFKTVNATVVSGEVFVKLPAGSASTSQSKPPKGFVRLQGAETIPVGSILDTKKGRVKIRSAATTGRKLQTGQFFRGRFKLRQVRIKRRSKKLVTDTVLNGSSFRTACRARKATISAKRKRSKKRVRRLFGNAKGSFRTSGRNAAATVRGTRWSVQDRCDGTKVTVQRGRVEVRDKVKRKTIIVRTGHTYLARRR